VDQATIWTSTNVPEWQSGHVYRIRSRANDTVGNQESTEAEDTFIFDDTDPIAYIISPLGTYYKELDTITGTAVDTESPEAAGLHRVEIQIERKGSPNYYWTGSSWTTPAIADWDDATNQANWRYTDLPAWESGETYAVTMKAWDNVDNYQTQISSVEFIFDDTPPSSGVQLPEEGEGYNSTTKQLVTISGTAYDATAGINNDEVKLSIRVDNLPLGEEGGAEDRWWDHAESTFTQTSEEWILATVYDVVGGTKYWRYTAPAWISGKTYRIRTKSVDNIVANAETDINIRTFSVDIEPPESRVVLPTNTGSYRLLPTLSGTAIDDSAGVDYVEIKIYSPDLAAGTRYWDGEGWTTETWVTCEGSTTWRYTDVPDWPSGISYTITCKAYDKSENIETPDEIAGKVVNVKLLEEILEQENYTNVFSTTDSRQVKALDQQWHFYSQ